MFQELGPPQSREQAQGVNQINAAMGQVDQVTQRTAAAAEELASTAEEMAAQSESLSELVAFFTVADAKEPTGVKSSGKSTTRAAKPRIAYQPRSMVMAQVD